MVGEITRWLNGSAGIDRRHSRNLELIENATELAETRVSGINRVAKKALYETMLVNILRARAEQLAPDGAELYAMITVAGAVASTEVVHDLGHRRCGR